ncbi:uncharacterized protein LOC102807561 [Saccoglossus kowalevskii]|uniref:Uncharacterized protein LOC102807561 n=1 Tax=Saccoglossus kowalevskii TaxID=10224 RepID=A0ABM0M426_SACKO|nr:PREDICTED: uncharacterized protein LOC102807561 [Saccoglossus kowalevskii]
MTEIETLSHMDEMKNSSLSSREVASLATKCDNPNHCKSAEEMNVDDSSREYVSDDQVDSDSDMMKLDNDSDSARCMNNVAGVKCQTSLLYNDANDLPDTESGKQSIEIKTIVPENESVKHSIKSRIGESSAADSVLHIKNVNNDSDTSNNGKTKRNVPWNMDKGTKKCQNFRTNFSTRNGNTIVDETPVVGLSVDKVKCMFKDLNPKSSDFEQLLWDLNIISLHTAYGLLHGVIYYNCVIFGTGNSDDHQAICACCFKTGLDKQIGYVEYPTHECSYIRKSDLDCDVTKRRYDVSLKAVGLYDKYMTYIPKLGSFYRHPLPGQTINFSLQAIEPCIVHDLCHAVMQLPWKLYQKKHTSLKLMPTSLKKTICGKNTGKECDNNLNTVQYSGRNSQVVGQNSKHLSDENKSIKDIKKKTACQLGDISNGMGFDNYNDNDKSLNNTELEVTCSTECHKTSEETKVGDENLVMVEDMNLDSQTSNMDSRFGNKDSRSQTSSKQVVNYRNKIDCSSNLNLAAEKNNAIHKENDNEQNNVRHDNQSDCDDGSGVSGIIDSNAVRKTDEHADLQKDSDNEVEKEACDVYLAKRSVVTDELLFAFGLDLAKELAEDPILSEIRKEKEEPEMQDKEFSSNSKPKAETTNQGSATCAPTSASMPNSTGASFVKVVSMATTAMFNQPPVNIASTKLAAQYVPAQHPIKRVRPHQITVQHLLQSARQQRIVSIQQQQIARQPISMVVQQTFSSPAPNTPVAPGAVVARQPMVAPQSACHVVHPPDILYIKMVHNLELYRCARCYAAMAHTYPNAGVLQPAILDIVVEHVKIQHNVTNFTLVSKSPAFKFYRCVHCTYQTFRHATILMHLSTLHPHYIPGTSTTSEVASCKDAIKTIKPNGESVYKCRRCPYEGSTIMAISYHCGLKHNSHLKSEVTVPRVSVVESVQLPMLVCTNCSFSTSNRSVLTSHMKYCSRLVGENEIMSTAKTVDYVTVKTYGGSTQYTCKHCTYRTEKLMSITYHVKKNHQGSDVYRCKLCPFASYVSATLVAHYHEHHYGVIPGTPDMRNDIGPVFEIDSTNREISVNFAVLQRCKLCMLMFLKVEECEMHIQKAHASFAKNPQNCHDRVKLPNSCLPTQLLNDLSLNGHCCGHIPPQAAQLCQSTSQEMFIGSACTTGMKAQKRKSTTCGKSDIGSKKKVKIGNCTEKKTAKCDNGDETAEMDTDKVMLDYLITLTESQGRTVSFGCDTCEESFMRYQAFTAHKCFQHDSEECQCLVFVPKSTVLRHFEASDNPSKWVCNICRILVHKNINLPKHLSKHLLPSVQLMFSGELSKKKNQSLKKHMQPQQGKNNWSCVSDHRGSSEDFIEVDLSCYYKCTSRLKSPVKASKLYACKSRKCCFESDFMEEVAGHLGIHLKCEILFRPSNGKLIMKKDDIHTFFEAQNRGSKKRFRYCCTLCGLNVTASSITQHLQRCLLNPPAGKTETEDVEQETSPETSLMNEIENTDKEPVEMNTQEAINHFIPVFDMKTKNFKFVCIFPDCTFQLQNADLATFHLTSHIKRKIIPVMTPVNIPDEETLKFFKETNIKDIGYLFCKEDNCSYHVLIEEGFIQKAKEHRRECHSLMDDVWTNDTTCLTVQVNDIKSFFPKSGEALIQKGEQSYWVPILQCHHNCGFQAPCDKYATFVEHFESHMESKIRIIHSASQNDVVSHKEKAKPRRDRAEIKSADSSGNSCRSKIKSHDSCSSNIVLNDSSDGNVRPSMKAGDKGDILKCRSIVKADASQDNCVSHLKSDNASYDSDRPQINSDDTPEGSKKDETAFQETKMLLKDVISHYDEEIINVRTSTVSYGKPQYTCKKCDFQTLKASALSTHLEIHLGQKIIVISSHKVRNYVQPVFQLKSPIQNKAEKKKGKIKLATTRMDTSTKYYARKKKEVLRKKYSLNKKAKVGKSARRRKKLGNSGIEKSKKTSQDGSVLDSLTTDTGMTEMNKQRVSRRKSSRPQKIVKFGNSGSDSNKAQNQSIKIKIEPEEVVAASAEPLKTVENSAFQESIRELKTWVQTSNAKIKLTLKECLYYFEEDLQMKEKRGKQKMSYAKVLYTCKGCDFKSDNAETMPGHIDFHMANLV